MLDDGRFPVDFNGKCSLLTLTSSFTTSPIIYSKKLLAGSEGSDCSSLQDHDGIKAVCDDFDGATSAANGLPSG
ncbi:hypothetical protein C4D60_Mb03t05700 [Musa balbisiana]|uniref:Uncharacterized protein n=1 Tax=Musa balbisiana TaxID=52838 RepID=A0A4S8J9I3_MUSBA|nr:hypothetical protein C4D60_Mb03t05700 [Musa balbisiana]